MASKPENGLLNVYLINGEDHLKRDRAISRMKIRLEKLGDLSFNSDTFDGATAQGAQIIDACKTLPFASEKRLVIVNDAEKLSSESQNALCEYLKDPNPTTVLLLLSNKLAKNKRLYKEVAKSSPKAIIDCTPVKERNLPSHIRQLAPGHGITLTQGAASALVELVGEDTLHLDGQLQKLALSFPGQSEITEANVREVVARTNEPKPWDFVNAFSSRNLRESIRLLSLIRSTSPNFLLRQCVARIRELICAKCLEATGSFSANQLASMLDIDQSWKVEKYGYYASRFSQKELVDALESSLACEREMKSGADPDATFKIWVVEVLAK